MNTNRIEWYDECAEPPWKAVERLHAMRQIKDRYKCACGHLKLDHRRDGQCRAPECRRCHGFKPVKR